NRPNLDSSLLGAGNTPGNVDRFIEVRRVDQEEPAELFTRLRERSVRDLTLSVTNTNAGRSRHRLQRRTTKVFGLFLEFMGQRRGLRIALLAFAFGIGLLVGVNEQHVLHRFLLGNWPGNRRLCLVVVRRPCKSTWERFFLTAILEAVFAGTGVRAPVW